MNYLEIQKATAKQLSEIDIDEISLVDKPCVASFMIMKSDKPKPKFENVQRLFLGYADSDIDLLDDEIIKEMKVEKSSKSNPFPNLAKKLNRHSDAYIEILNGLEACFYDNRCNTDA